MSIGLVAKTTRIRLSIKDPALATGRTTRYSGDANRRANMANKQRRIARRTKQEAAPK